MSENGSKNTGPAIGLALSGGIVRGFVHLGVLQVLEEEGIEITHIGGASVGSLIGYCFAAGMSLEQIDSFSQKMSWWRMARPAFPPWEGFISFQKMEDWLIDMLGDLHFTDLARPFVVSTTDLETGRPLLIKEGAVAPAVRASCSVPGLVEPAHLNDHLLCDGGISKNTPAQAVRELGADYVIGVDVFYPTLRTKLGPFGPGLAAIEIMVQQSGQGVDEADCLITPELENVTWINFKKRPDLIAHGREAARAKLSELKSEIGSWRPKLPQ